MEEIASLMKEKGYDVTAVNCDNKWKALLHAYRLVEDHNSQSGNGVLKDGPWHDEMAVIMGDKASTRPKSLVGSGLRRHLVETRQCRRPALLAQLMSMSTPTTPTRQRRGRAFPHQPPQPHQNQDLQRLHRHRGTDQLERNRHHVHKNGLA